MQAVKKNKELVSWYLWAGQ